MSPQKVRLPGKDADLLPQSLVSRERIFSLEKEGELHLRSPVSQARIRLPEKEEGDGLPQKEKARSARKEKDNPPDRAAGRNVKDLPGAIPRIRGASHEISEQLCHPN